MRIVSAAAIEQAEDVEVSREKGGLAQVSSCMGAKISGARDPEDKSGTGGALGLGYFACAKFRDDADPRVFGPWYFGVLPRVTRDPARTGSW
jgi:hypothetical protein